MPGLPPAGRRAAARVDLVRETRFGVTLADPYRQLEAGGAELGDWLAHELGA